MMNYKRMSRKGKLALIALIAGIFLMICIMSGYSLFYNGYAIGVITKDAHKTELSQYLCSHDWTDRSGNCMKCSLKCSHPKFDENNNCKICGYHHLHSFDHSICTSCGAECTHENWSKGICKDCGYICTHPEWNDDICVSCGIYCTHPEYENGICVLCGSPCMHSTWNDGKCEYCGLVCEHENHDRDTGICGRCGECVYHDFSKGVCNCGLTPPFEKGQLRNGILEECAKKRNCKNSNVHNKKV